MPVYSYALFSLCRDCVGAGRLRPWRDCVGAGRLRPSLWARVLAGERVPYPLPPLVDAMHRKDMLFQVRYGRLDLDA
jgi:hypothetical protein